MRYDRKQEFNFKLNNQLVEEMAMKKLLLFAPLLVFCFQIEAQVFNSLEDAKIIIENSIQIFSEKRFQEAIDLIKPYIRVSPMELDSVAINSKITWEKIEEKYGKKIDVVFINNVVIKSMIAKYIYIVRFERGFLVFEVVVYKNSEGWILMKYHFDDEGDKLF
jgi:hypothetical protein